MSANVCMTLFRAYPNLGFTPVVPCSFPFLFTVAPRVTVSDRSNCCSQTVIMWCELWLPTDSLATIQWHRANDSRAVKKPLSAMVTAQREWEWERGDK